MLNDAHTASGGSVDAVSEKKKEIWPSGDTDSASAADSESAPWAPLS